MLLKETPKSSAFKSQAFAIFFPTTKKKTPTWCQAYISSPSWKEGFNCYCQERLLAGNTSFLWEQNRPTVLIGTSPVVFGLGGYANHTGTSLAQEGECKCTNTVPQPHLVPESSYSDSRGVINTLQPCIYVCATQLGTWRRLPMET